MLSLSDLAPRRISHLIRIRSVRRAALLPALCAAVLAAPSAQTPVEQANTSPAAAQQPTFRGGVNYVRVDMYPTLDGRPVTDLRRDEVQLFEEGAPQEIDTFEHVQIPHGGPEALRVEPNSIEAGRQMAADPRARVFVVFIDSYHLDVSVTQQLRNPIRRFLEQALGPDDLVAVLTAETPTSAMTFTRRTTVLSGILADTAEWLRRDATIYRFDEVERMYERCYGLGPGSIAPEMIARRREKLALDGLEELASHLGILRDERKTVLVISKGWWLYEESDRLRNSGAGVPPPPDDVLRRGRGRDGTDSYRADSSLQNQCETDRMALASLNHRNRLQEITGVANRGNVSLYPFLPLRLENTLSTVSNMRGLAEDTDGIAVVNTNNIDEPIRRIIADTSSYYLLGYQSTNAELDGRFRRISVRISRPGVQVRARRGYRAVSAAEMREATKTSTASKPSNAATAAIARVAAAVVPLPLRLRASAWRPGAPGAQPHLWVTGEIDEATRRNAAWSSGARGEVAVLAADGMPLATQTVDLAKGVSSFAVPVALARAPAAGDDLVVRVRLQPSSAAAEPIADTIRATFPEAGVVGEPLLQRRGPQTGIRYVPTADIRFRRNERLRLEIPAAATAGATARVLDRAGNPTPVPVQVTSRDEPAAGFSWLVVETALAPLAAGDYALEVTQQEVTRLLAFRIVN